MDIYQDYADWKSENHDFIFTLVKNRSKTISRFTSVIAVVDYLYDQYSVKKSLTEDEEVFFSSGFDYIYDQFHLIKTIFEYKFNSDFSEMEKYAPTINLLLFINEFQAEALDHKNLDPKDLKPLDDLEDKVNKALDAKQNVEEEYFGLLNDITNKLFEQNGIEVNTMDQIYYEIAVEYEIYQDDDFDVYNEVLNKHIEDDRKKQIN